MSNEKKIILITTRYYPIVNGWENKEIHLTGSEMELAKPYFLDFENEDRCDAFINKPVIKTKVIDKYIIHIAPCLKTEDKKTRHNYLNAIIQSVKNDDNDWYDNFLLISHDRDFGKTIDGHIVETDYIQGVNNEYSELRKLIDVHHVYLFMHDLKKSLGWFINTEKLNNPNNITDAVCDKLWDQITILKYYNDCNSDANNLYPKIVENVAQQKIKNHE